MSDKTKTPQELRDETLDEVQGAGTNNLKQLGLASHNFDSSAHAGGVNVLLADGSVRGVKDTITR